MFELNGEPVTLEFLQSKAAEYNMDFDSYKEKMKAKGLKEIEPEKTISPDFDNSKVRKELGFNYGEEQKYLRNKTIPERLKSNLGKTTPPQEEQGATAEVMAAPEIPPTVTDSKQEDGLLESQIYKGKAEGPTQYKKYDLETKVPEISYEAKNNLNVDLPNMEDIYKKTEELFKNFDPKSKSQIEKNNLDVFNKLINSDNYIQSFPKQVETANKETIGNKIKDLLKTYNLDSEEDRNSVEYQKRLKEANQDFAAFYNKLVNDAAMSSEGYLSRIKAYEEALDFENEKVAKKYSEVLKERDIQAVEAAIETTALGILPEGSFRRGLYKLGFTIPQSFQATEALTNATKIQKYNKAIEGLEGREERIKKQAIDEGWSPEITKEQLALYLDPTIASSKKIANSKEEAIQYYKNKIKEEQKDFLENIASTQEYQKTINMFGDAPEILDDDGITMSEFGEMMGTQLGQMAQGALTLGLGTFIQEAGGSTIEALNKLGAEKKGLSEEAFNAMPDEEKRNIYLDVLNNNEINWNGIIAASTGSAGLDLVGNFVSIGAATKVVPKNVIRNLLNGQFKRAIKNSKGGAVEILKAVATETPTEMTQEVFNISGVGLATGQYDWSSKRIGEAGLQALITTGPLIAGGRTTVQSLKEGARTITGLVNDESIRAEINRQSEIIKGFKNLTEEQKTDALDDLYTTEILTSNKRFRKFKPEAKYKMFDLEVEKTSLERKNKQLEGSIGYSESTFNQAVVEKNKDRIKELETEKGKVVKLQDYLLTGKKFASYFNNQEEIPGKFFIFNTNEEIISFLEGKGIDYKKDKELIDLLAGESSGVVKNGIAIIHEGNTRKEIESSNFVQVGPLIVETGGVASNVVHHEGLHFILNNSSPEIVSEIVKNIKEFVNKGNDKLLKALVKAAELRVEESYSNKSERAQEQEFITSLSDFMNSGMLSEETVNVEGSKILSKIGEFIAKILGRNKPESLNFTALENPAEIIKFLAKYNQFNGKTKLKFNLPKLKAAAYQNADPEEETQATRNLKKVFDNFVQNEDGTKKYNTKEEFQQSADMFSAYQAIIDPNPELDAEIAKGTAAAGIFDAALENFITSVKENLSERFIKNFDPTKNESLFGWMMGKTPVLQKAKLDVIAKYKKTKALEADLEIQKGGEIITKDIISEDLSIEDQIDLSMQDFDLSQGLIEPLEELTSDQNIIKTFKNTVKEKLPTDIKELEKINYKNLKDYAPKVTAQIFGKKTKDKQQFIRNNAKKLYDLLPLGAMKKAVGLKTATGVQRTLLNNFYEKGARQTMAEGTAAGLNVQEKLPFNKNKFLEVFGALEGQTQDRNQITAIKALEAEIGKAITNRTVRKALNEVGVPDGIISTIADGKSETMAQAKLRPILFKTDKYNKKYINFKNVDQVTSGRAAIIKLAEILGVQNTMKYLLPTIQRGWGTLAGGYVPNKQDMELFQVFKPGKKNDSDQVKFKTRMFLFLGRKDFFNALNYFTDNNIKYVSGGKEVTWNNNVIETTKVPPQNTKGFTKGEFEGEKLDNRIDFAQDQRKGLKLIVETLADLYNKKEISKNDVGMVMSTFNSSVDALVRTAAIPGLEFRIDGLTDDDYRYEHTKTASDVLAELTKLILNPKYSTFEKIMDDYRVAIIPKDYDAAINKAHKSNGPIDSKGSLIKGEGTKVARYTSKEAITEIKKAGLGPLKLVDKVAEETMASRSLSKEFNEQILQATTGVKWTENYSPSTAKMLARGKGKGNLFIPYSAEDFVGLLYTTLAEREVGNKQMEWYNENLIRPFSRGIQAYEAEKQKAMREWSVLKQRATKDVPGGLKKKNESGFTNEESLRMYIWQRQGMEIPNIQKGEVNKAIRAVRNNKKFKEFADTLMSLNPEGYPEPSNNWFDGDITSDLIGYVNGAKRAEFLTEWKENVDQIFSEKNKTKLRALYGDRYVEALEDILFRMERGTNRSKGTNKQTRAWMDWVNNSVGTIMFFNARSAVLQTLSTVNFINFTDNNPINAAIALANFSQYRQDFVDLFNSDFLKQRRSGLQIDVNADEIAKATKGNEKSPRAILKALLQFGFTPTQIADSFAIAAGGATFYRNRINKYIKEGLSETEAQKRAFTDFQEIAEETQQSARPDRISMEQASSLGRVILAFANTPMQYARLQKKAFLDLINRRGDWKTNTSKIMYYGVIQNVIFSALQNALFALLFDDEDEAEEKSRYYKIANSSFDTLLRGVGVAGAGAATVKNIILEIIEQTKSGRPDYEQAAIAATSISPPINSKLKKLLAAARAFTYKQSREKIFTEGLSLENPALLAAGQVLSAGLNIPADRVVIKADHLYTAMQPETELWQSIALSLGWPEWDLGMIEKQTKSAKKPVKKNKKRSIRKKTLRKK